MTSPKCKESSAQNIIITEKIQLDFWLKSSNGHSYDNEVEKLIKNFYFPYLQRFFGAFFVLPADNKMLLFPE